MSLTVCCYFTTHGAGRVYVYLQLLTDDFCCYRCHFRVSSVLNRDVKQYGKKYMFDCNEETCWNSDQVQIQLCPIYILRLLYWNCYNTLFVQFVCKKPIYLLFYTHRTDYSNCNLKMQPVCFCLTTIHLLFHTTLWEMCTVAPQSIQACFVLDWSGLHFKWIKLSFLTHESALSNLLWQSENMWRINLNLIKH